MNILKQILPFLAIMNPFALCLYLTAVMEELETKVFLRVLFQACLISGAVFIIFALTGERLLVDFLSINPYALRTFGGLIFLIVGYNYVIKGYKAAVMLRGSLDELPSVIALPFMIGAGTITQSVFIGKANKPFTAVIVIISTLAMSYSIVVFFNFIRGHMKRKYEMVFERYINIFSRINGLVIGAISIEMIITGIQGVWTYKPII